MDIIIELFILAFGMGLLVKGADTFLESSSKIARHFGISDLIISLTLVSFATSLPEFGVTIMSALDGIPSISLSNIVGSGIANICLIIGIPAVFVGVKIHDKIINRDAVAMIVSYILLVLDIAVGGINLFFGLAFLLAYCVYLYYLYQHNKHSKVKMKKTNKLWKQFILLLLSVAAVYLGSRLSVNSAVSIAHAVGISEWVIGATILAIGTSLPELAVVTQSILKKKVIMGIGTAIGSNIFNILVILGLASIASPLNIPLSKIWVDMAILLLSAVLVTWFMTTGHKITRREGFFLIMLYMGYLAYLLFFRITLAN